MSLRCLGRVRSPSRLHIRWTVLLTVPVMGGMLADPVKIYPRLFGPNSSFGGETGVEWLIKYPYALPMLANFCFLSFCAGCVALGLEEVRFLLFSWTVLTILDTRSLQRQTRPGHLYDEDLLSFAQGCRSLFVSVVLETPVPGLRGGGSAVDSCYGADGELRDGRKGRQTAACHGAAVPADLDEERTLHAFGAGVLRLSDGVGSGSCDILAMLTAQCVQQPVAPFPLHPSLRPQRPDGPHAEPSIHLHRWPRHVPAERRIRDSYSRGHWHAPPIHHLPIHQRPTRHRKKLPVLPFPLPARVRVCAVYRARAVIHSAD